MKKKLSAYWWCQIGGWGTYVLVFTLFYFTIRTQPYPNYFPALFLEAITGILITHIMRLIILKMRLLQFNVLRQIVYLFFTTIFFSFVYTIIIIGADEVLHWEDELSKYSFWNKVGRIFFGYFIYLIIWNLIYFAYHYVQKSHQEQIDKIRLEDEIKLQQLEGEKTKAQLEKQKAELEMHAFCAQMNQLIKLQQMRTQIASDLHDEVGATLSSISIFSQAAIQKNESGNIADSKNILERIGETSREVMGELNDAVWLINPAQR